MKEIDIDAEIKRLQAAQVEAVREVNRQRTIAENRGVSPRESSGTFGARQAWIAFSEARGAEKALRSLKNSQ